jgi:hypothetical protein
MNQVFLPKDLQPSLCRTLKRVGKDFDGGYVIDSRNIEISDCLIGLGMNDDWSFEEHFANLHKIPTYIFDGTVGQPRFIKNLILSIIRIDNISLFFHWIKTIFKYYFFFKGSTQHIRLLVDDIKGEEFISFHDLVEKYFLEEDKKVFLKIDIEGSEYRLLDHLVNISDKISGMVIEFHNVDLHIDKIIKFTNNFSLKLCHVHVNNFGGVNNFDVPLAIECTYSSSTFNSSDVASCPHEIDMPNNPLSQDLQIIFN